MVNVPRIKTKINSYSMTKAPDSCGFSSSLPGGLFLTRPIMFRLKHFCGKKRAHSVARSE